MFFANLKLVTLSTTTRVVACGCPISSKANCIGTVQWVVRNVGGSVTIFVADKQTISIRDSTQHLACTSPFILECIASYSVRLGDVWPKNNIAPVQLFAHGYDMYDILLCTQKVALLALYHVLVSRLDPAQFINHFIYQLTILSAFVGASDWL